MQQTERGHWQSRIGFILAATGSAVGLGNLWKFPYITWVNEGGAFVLIYLVAVLLIGWPIMTAEILIGRRTQTNPVPAFEKLGNKWWGLVGWLGVLTGLVILGYYTVIAGWTITSFIDCTKWSFDQYVKPADGAFSEFTGDGSKQLLLSFVFMLATATIVWKGINKGIERATKILMPILLLIIVYMAIMVCFMPASEKTIQFLFRANFEDIGTEGILEAVGHAFFTLSLGMGAMITYGSYMSRKESIVKNAAIVVILDTVIAMFACLIMYTIIFSTPGEAANVEGSAIAMLFNTIPLLLYTEVPFGTVLAPIFFILVAFAALSSTISLLEVLTSLLIDKMKVKRRAAVVMAVASAYSVSILCALSLGAVSFLSDFNLFGKNKDGVLSSLDHLAANWMLPVGGLFITLFVGWFLDRKICEEELDLFDIDGNPTMTFKLFRFFIRFTAPAAIIAVIYAVVTGKDFS